MQTELEIFREFIRSKGLRQTPEREIILAEICRKREHFDVDELFLRLRGQDKKISKASIYRTLPLLVECGLIREVNFVDGHWHYEQIYGQPHHCHLRCLSCGAMVEFEEPRLAAVEAELSRKHGYQIIKHVLEVQGYCPHCHQKSSARDEEAKHV